MIAVGSGWGSRSARAVAIVVIGGLVAVGCGGGDGDGGDQGYVEPKGKATETLAIEGGNFYFDPSDPTASPGIARIDLVGAGGIHTFVFDDGAYPGFQLEVTGDDADAKKIDLEPGSYTFYCDVPGHRQQGMEGTLTVT
jgi:plastocyanin